MIFSTPISSFGFGDYTLPQGSTFARMQTCAKVQKIFYALFFTGMTALSIALIPVSMPLALLGAVAFSYQAIQMILKSIALFYRAPPMQNLIPNEIQAALPALGQLCHQPCSGFATQDGVESHAWKLKLIRAAQHTIFISGCYAGGSALDETLDLIRERLTQIPALRVSLLFSNMFITPENQKRIDTLRADFPHFQCLITPEVFPYVSPTTDELSITSNHTKALVVDYGTAFMIGGSGIVTPWTKQKGEKQADRVERLGFLYDHLSTIKGFRDMDFVFESPVLNGIGTRIYLEMSKLFERFQPQARPIQLPRQVEPIQFPRSIRGLKTALYATGPEKPSSQFIDAIVSEIEKAKKSVKIGHMYFHPTPKLLQALIDASNRGVKITLITNKLGNKSPGSHATYADLSDYYAKKLFEGRAKPEIEYCQFEVGFTTYHKKVIVIDERKAFLGSANIGKKSLEAQDYEIDLKVESAEFGQALSDSLEQDKQFCKRDESPDIPLKTRIYAAFQSFLTPFL